MAALSCLILSFLPFIDRWGLVVLPLAYLDWLGYGLLLLAIGLALHLHLTRGPYRYVEEGIPVAGRIIALQLQPSFSYNGQPNGFRFVALVDLKIQRLGSS